MPQQERPQDQLAQAQLLRHQHPYLPGGNAQHPPGRARHRAQEYALAGEQADLAQELRRAIRGDNRLAWLAVPLDDPDPTCQHHDQVITHIPVGKQHIAGGNVVLTAIPAQHLKLGRVQDWAAPSLGLLRRTRAAPGGGARRRSRSVRALRAARTLPHRVPATSLTRRTAAGPWPAGAAAQAGYALPGRSDCTCPQLVATMHHARHIGGPILIGLDVGIDYVAPFTGHFPLSPQQGCDRLPVVEGQRAEQAIGHHRADLARALAGLGATLSRLGNCRHQHR